MKKIPTELNLSQKACDVHLHHDHQHGVACGHKAVKHGDHLDYVHDGHLHRIHGNHVDECNGSEGVNSKD